MNDRTFLKLFLAFAKAKTGTYQFNDWSNCALAQFVRVYYGKRLISTNHTGYITKGWFMYSHHEYPYKAYRAAQNSRWSWEELAKKLEDLQ